VESFDLTNDSASFPDHQKSSANCGKPNASFNTGFMEAKKSLMPQLNEL
jgi:hypothetical protein